MVAERKIKVLTRSLGGAESRNQGQISSLGATGLAFLFPALITADGAVQAMQMVPASNHCRRWLQP